jgi:hypothetical protein
MKPDPLESELRRQPFRDIPSAWRNEILAAARPTPAASTWRDYLWPHPRAWAALGAAWVTIAGFLVAARVESRATRGSESERATARAWIAQASQRAQFSESLPSTALPPVVPEKRPAKSGQSWIDRPVPVAT